MAGYEGKPLDQDGSAVPDSPQGDEQESEPTEKSSGDAAIEGEQEEEEEEEEDSSAAEAIMIEKDRNKSEYEGRAGNLLGSLEGVEGEPGAQWGPRFATDRHQKEKLAVGEAAEATPSVSSSKFTLGAENRVLEDVSSESKSQTKKLFSLEDLRRVVRAQMIRFRNATEAAPFSLLSCPVSFAEKFHFKGQIIATP